MSGGGGLLNLVATGNQNVILFGNPTKTFFKAKYAKHTNFGLQKFRLDYDGLRKLRMHEESHFEFKVKRYGDLLMDTYLVVTLPHIWSPLYPPQNENESWRGYEFRWIDHIGTEMIKEISMSVGGQVLQRFSGAYIRNMVDRDYDTNKKNLFNKMSGNINELNDPANSDGRINNYPSAVYTTNADGAHPSIMGRKLYIPIPFWFNHSSKLALPLVALQYNEVVINVTLRPVFELFRIKDVGDTANDYPVVQPSLAEEYMQLYRFLQTPPSEALTEDDYTNKSLEWNAEVHLMSTYGFLSTEERQQFARSTHEFLIKDIQQHDHQNIVGSKVVKLETSGLVSSMMWFFRRNDVNLRNEWNNYSNWPYNYIPNNVQYTPLTGTYQYTGYNLTSVTNANGQSFDIEGGIGPGTNPNGGTPVPSYNTFTGDFSADNRKHIMNEMGIKFEGNYRENKMDFGIYEYIEPYSRSSGDGNDGTYYYNFCLQTNPHEYQPSGAINLNKFKTIELEFTTYLPPLDENAKVLTICDENGNIIGVNKSDWNIYKYTYDLTLFEEKYNVIRISAGTCGLMFAR